MMWLIIAAIVMCVLVVRRAAVLAVQRAATALVLAAAKVPSAVGADDVTLHV